MALAALGLNRFYLTGERFTLLHMMELAGYTVLRWSAPPPPPPPPALLPRELELRSLLSGVVQHSTTLTQGQGHIGKQSVGWAAVSRDTQV